MLRYTRISDPEVYELTQKELRRQEKNIEMIASESTVPPEIMELQGSVFTNKTLEGYPGARYQAGSRVAGLIAKVAADPENRENLAQVREEAEAIAARHPLYPAGVFED